MTKSVVQESWLIDCLNGEARLRPIHKLLTEYPDHITHLKNDLSDTYTSMYDIWKQKKNRLKIIQVHLVMFFFCFFFSRKIQHDRE